MLKNLLHAFSRMNLRLSYHTCLHDSSSLHVPKGLFIQAQQCILVVINQLFLPQYNLPHLKLKYILLGHCNFAVTPRHCAVSAALQCNASMNGPLRGNYLC